MKKKHIIIILLVLSLPIFFLGRYLWLYAQYGPFEPRENIYDSTPIDQINYWDFAGAIGGILNSGVEIKPRIISSSVDYYTYENGNFQFAFSTIPGEKYWPASETPNLLYGLGSLPTYQIGWRCAIPFVSESDYPDIFPPTRSWEELTSKRYYVRMSDLKKVAREWDVLPWTNIERGSVKLGNPLYFADRMLIQNGIYLSLDFLFSFENPRTY